MKKFFAVAMAILFCACFLADQAGALIYGPQLPTEDSDVFNGNPFYNNGGDGALQVYVKPDNGHTWRTYLKFNLSTIPDNSNITSAVLSLYCYFDIDNLSTPVNVHYVSNDNWFESSVTWNTQPLPSPGPANFLHDRKIAAEGWVNWDLLHSGNWNYPADLQDNQLSLLVRFAFDDTPGSYSTTASSKFHSKDQTTYPHLRPRLTIEYQAIPLPGTMILLGSGLVGFLGLGRRFQSRV